MKALTPTKQLDAFLAKYTPEMQRLGRALRKKMRARLPGTVEMVYDNYNALVIGYGPNDRASQAIFSLALFPRWVCLCFLQGAGLPDPDRLLLGSGNVVRHIKIADVEEWDRPAVQALIAAGLDRAKTPVEESTPHQLIIKSISEKQRPRRPTK